MRSGIVGARSAGARVADACVLRFGRILAALTAVAFALMGAATLAGAAQESAGGEANLKLPDLSTVNFLSAEIDGHRLLLWGILFCFFGLAFGLTIYMRLKNLAGTPLRCARCPS